MDTYQQYVITRLPDGGFVINKPGIPGVMPAPLFASTSCVEALAYIKDKLDPRK